MRISKSLVRIVFFALLFLLTSLTANQRVYAQATGLAYSDDPSTGHYSIWGPNVLISYTGPVGTQFRLCSSGCTGYAATGGNPAQMGGFNSVMTSAGNGAWIYVDPGGAGCTMQVVGVYRYCGVPIPDSDGDGVSNPVDSCPSEGNLGNGVFPNGCPMPLIPTPPQPTEGDRDGDGILDRSDRCPGDYGPRNNSGCPLPDQDRDGVPDANDGCPNDPGLMSNGGCATGGPVSTPIPTAILLPATPDPNRSCNLTAATGVTQPINVREQPATSSTDNIVGILGQFFPHQGPFLILEAIGEGINGWYRIEFEGTSGWVSGEFVQYGGQGCEQVVVTRPLLNLNVAFENCPENIGYVEALPYELQSIYVTNPDPCSAIDLLQDDSADIDWEVGESMATLFSVCPTEAPGYLQFYASLRRADASDAAEFNAEVNQSGICGYRDFARASNQEGYVDTRQVVSCLNGVEPRHAAAVVRLAEELEITFDPTNTSMCNAIINLAILGKLTELQQQFLDTITEVCGWPKLSVLSLLIYAIQLNSDFQSILNSQISCSAILELIEDSAQDIDIPQQLQLCEVAWVNLFLNVVGQEESPLSDVAIASIYGTADPCNWIQKYLLYGTLPIIPPPIDERPNQESGQNQNEVIIPELVDDPVDGENLLGDGVAVVNSEDTERFGLFANPFLGVTAYFISNSPDQRTTDIYVLENGEYRPLQPNTPVNELSVAASNFGWLAYLIEDLSSGEISMLYRQSMAAPAYELPLPAAYQIDPTSRIAWHPSERKLWITVIGPEPNRFAIYQFDLLNPTQILGRIVIENARNPSPTDVGQLLYERIAGNAIILERQSINNLSSRAGVALAVGEAAIQPCHTPTSFDALENRFMFVCSNAIGFGNMFGAGDVAIIPLEMDTIRNLARVPNTDQYITLDDGMSIYYFTLQSGSQPLNEYLRIGQTTTGLIWRLGR